MELIEAEVRQCGSVSVLSLTGRLVLGHSANGLRAAVADMLDAGNRLIAINLAGVPYTDSAGLGALAVSFSIIKSAEGSLAIAEAQPMVRDLLELTGLARLIPLFDNEAQAIDSLSRAT